MPYRGTLDHDAYTSMAGNRPAFKGGSNYAQTNWKFIEDITDGYKLYFRFVEWKGKPVKIFQCTKEQPNDNNEGGYFDKDAACAYH